MLQGENPLLFGQAEAEGPHAFSFFVKSSVDTSDNSTIYFGPSVLFGKTDSTVIIPNTEVKGNSALYGTGSSLEMEAREPYGPDNSERIPASDAVREYGRSDDALCH